MIPAIITKAHIIEAIRRIGREGVPARRRGRDYCLATNGTHFPPKYTIALAHEVATGERLSSNEFSGGAESNGFLASRGFNVVECNCGGRNQERSATSMSGMPERRMPVAARTRHSERCPECKDRVQELLERIYGSCLPNHRFRWQCGFSSYAGTAIEPALRYVAEALKKYRGFGVEEFVRSQWLAPCDFFVSDRGFIVEFDESQHFTKPRALALAAYADEYPLGFPARRWISLCEQYNRKDSDPLYRDEQRAWYDSLRDLVPQLEGMGPTVRLYASELTWCALDPDDRRDRQRFASLIRSGSAPANLTGERGRIAAGRSPSRLRVAMVFPGSKEVIERRSAEWSGRPTTCSAQGGVIPGRGHRLCPLSGRLHPLVRRATCQVAEEARIEAEGPPVGRRSRRGRRLNRPRLAGSSPFWSGWLLFPDLHEALDRGGCRFRKAGLGAGRYAANL